MSARSTPSRIDFAENPPPSGSGDLVELYDGPWDGRMAVVVDPSERLWVTYHAHRGLEPISAIRKPRGSDVRGCYIYDPLATLLRWRRT